MNKTVIALAILAALPAFGQSVVTPPPAPSNITEIIEDFRPSTLNQQGKRYPMVNSQRVVRAQISAPNATSVQLDIGGRRYDMKNDGNGLWTGDSAPQDEGFHYYQLNIDGASVPDPGSLYFYGASRWGSGVEVPSKDEDFFALKNVPHGQTASVYFWSPSTNSTQHCFIYTPPGYDKDINKKYPVLYLQHGGGENHYGWAQQGFTSRIMDNLIAENKAVPFIIVMANSNVGGGGARGGAPRGGGAAPGGMPGGMPGGRMGGMPGAGGPPSPADPGAPAGGRMGGGMPGGMPGGAPAGGARRGGMGGMGGMTFTAFQTVLIDELIPFVEANYRVHADQAHRAMAGLSMGGMQTRSISLAKPEMFSHLGIFSGGTYNPTELEPLKKNLKLVYMSYGSRENAQSAIDAAKALNDAGYKAVSYVSPDTAHEWLSWRRSLYTFAPLLFRD